MAGYFEPLSGGDGGAAIALDHVEISILRSLATQLIELIGIDHAAEGDPGEVDPLSALFVEGPTEPPSDPALARLFPDAYGEPGRPEDDESTRLSAEFRRFTESDLRTRKREDLLALVRSLDSIASEAKAAGESGAVLTLKAEEARQWLGALNDLRLAIGTRLDVRDDEGSERLFELPESDPKKPLVMAFFWLGGLQESLVETLMP
ncbi:DUF2017 domain-containing protein [Streptomyces radicis]|uniref:DUF2017 domain-containing protein n=1 Tax=Streptomyces radicis TaxID=1750517 RepID=A0A3A9W4R8_9ACTN|nr:DUF2017 domain-containing protein [Streptomyces radicis]RKN07840.1 DUF2017 domain-containing protein [Streptomyces radicis]RKN20706.1 DUF2017 domain-containing protein [Streptomyces radicis]